MDIELEVEAMGRLARGMLVEAGEAFQTNDRDAAKRVLDRLARLAALDEAIEAAAIQELCQRPAPDRARRLAALLKIITSLNRIGRYGGDLARAALRLDHAPPAPSDRLAQMAGDVEAMVATVTQAIGGEPLDGSSLLALEDEVDRADLEVRAAVIEALGRPGADAQALVELALASRALERCADHACKMAEKLHAAMLGERIVYR